MSDPINIRDLAVGTRVMLANGDEVEIIDNPHDGVWLFARHPSGDEEMIFAQDVVEIRHSKQAAREG